MKTHTKYEFFPFFEKKAKSLPLNYNIVVYCCVLLLLYNKYECFITSVCLYNSERKQQKTKRKCENKRRKKNGFNRVTVWVWNKNNNNRKKWFYWLPIHTLSFYHFSAVVYDCSASGVCVWLIYNKRHKFCSSFNIVVGISVLF